MKNKFFSVMFICILCVILLCGCFSNTNINTNNNNNAATKGDYLKLATVRFQFIDTEKFLEETIPVYRFNRQLFFDGGYNDSNSIYTTNGSNKKPFDIYDMINSWIRNVKDCSYFLYSISSDKGNFSTNNIQRGSLSSDKLKLSTLNCFAVQIYDNQNNRYKFYVNFYRKAQIKVNIFLNGERNKPDNVLYVNEEEEHFNETEIGSLYNQLPITALYFNNNKMYQVGLNKDSWKLDSYYGVAITNKLTINSEFIKKHNAEINIYYTGLRQYSDSETGELKTIPNIDLISPAY